VLVVATENVDVLQFHCALRMYLSDPILYYLTEIETVAPSGVVHPRLWENLYKMSSDLLYMGRGEFCYDRYPVLLQTAYMQSAGAAKLDVKTRVYRLRT
jgi:hypothetical protein